MSENAQKCQKCGSPIKPGMKFCESCGAKVEVLPACPKCGAPLPANVRFCESCGAPVLPAASAAAAAVKEAAKIPEPESGTAKSPAETTPGTPGPATAPVAPEPIPVPESRPPAEPIVKGEEKTVPLPEEKPAPAKKAPAMAERPKEVPKGTVPGKSGSQTTMIIAGVVVLAIIGAAVYFVGLPMLSGSGTSPQPPQAPASSPAATGTGASPVSPAATAGTSAASAVSFTPGQTQVPPANRVIILDAERDPISSLVTVTFKGGAGQNGVREIQVTLTRSDGILESKSFKPDAIGSGVTLQGTAKTDRVEATTYFYTGEQYKILDQVFEYKKRGG